MEQGGWYYYYFINQVVGGFIRSMADFFGMELYDRTNEIVIGTYEKAIQHYKNRITEAGEKHAPKFPFISFDPGLDFEPEDRAGRFFYQYPSFENRLSAKSFGPIIYNDGNVQISPVLNRYRGTFEITVWCGSVYELIDLRILTYQFFGGLDRYIYPRNIEGYFILPEELVFYTYDNPYTGQEYQLDWTGSDLSQMLIKNINRNKYVFPFTMTPYVKLTAVGDGAEKFGGADDTISEHRLLVSLEWECQLPTHLAFLSTSLPDPWHKIVFYIDAGAGYHRIQPGTEGIIPMEEIISITDSTGGANATIKTVETRLKQAYNYILTQEDEDKINAGERIPIALLEPLPAFDYVYLKIYAKYGPMTYGLHWELPDIQTVNLLGFNLTSLKKGDVIVISVYENLN
jgi:hypothetical protein